MRDVREMNEKGREERKMEESILRDGEEERKGERK